MNTKKRSTSHKYRYFRAVFSREWAENQKPQKNATTPNFTSVVAFL
ncbi:MAG: hypothetical protein RL494_313 [Bacteroidota bacterium]|jgi:LPS sulfotransferase NodH